MSIHTKLLFNDLSFEKQQELIDWVAEIMTEEAKEETDQMESNFPNAICWQEIYYRLYDIDADIWNEYTEKKDWEFAFESLMQDQADHKLRKAIDQLEVEINL